MWWEKRTVGAAKLTTHTLRVLTAHGCIDAAKVVQRPMHERTRERWADRWNLIFTEYPAQTWRGLPSNDVKHGLKYEQLRKLAETIATLNGAS